MSEYLFCLNLFTGAYQTQIRSNSVNVKHATPNNLNTSDAANQHHAQNTYATLNHSAPIANRKPSFKFESSILNRVQNMNLNSSSSTNNNTKIKCMPSNKMPRQPTAASTNKASSQAYLNEQDTLSHHSEEYSDDVFSKSSNSAVTHSSHSNNMVTTNDFIKRASLNSSSASSSSAMSYNNYDTTTQIKRQQSINKAQQQQIQQQQQRHHYDTSGGKSNNHQISLDSGIYLPSESEEVSLSSGQFIK